MRPPADSRGRGHRGSGARAAALCALASLAGTGACGTNHPPDVEPLPALEVEAGAVLEVPLRASDPDGDSVRFQVRGGPATLAVREGDPWRLVAEPTARDAAPGGMRYDLEVVATDGAGGRTSVPAVLTVWPQGSTPAFQGPFAWTLDLAAADRLVMPIRVRDDDTADVALALVQGPEGAVFERWDGHQASLYWKPTATQATAGTLWTFTVSADDGDHRVETREFAIAMVNADLFGGCPGSPPAGLHVPPTDRAGPGGLALEVRARDDDSRAASVTCRWTATGDPDGPDRNALALADDGQGVFRGTLPDLSAAAGDAGLLVRYACTIVDDDDPAAASCDHARRMPKEGDFAVALRRDADASCPRDGSGADAGGAPLPWGWTDGLRLCDDAGESFTVDLQAGEGVAARAQAQSAGAVRLEVRDDDGSLRAEGPSGLVRFQADAAGTWRLVARRDGGEAVTWSLRAAPWDGRCDDDPAGPDDDPAFATPLAAGSVQGVLCPADVDHRLLRLRAGQAARLALAFDPAAADLDLALLDPAGGEVLDVSDGTGGTERLVLATDADRDVVVRVSSADLRGAAWTLDVRVDEGACRDDLLAPSGTVDDAPVLPEGTWENLRLCGGGVDYVRLGLNGGETLTASVAGEGGADAPPLALLSATGDLLAAGTPEGGARVASTVVPGPGDVLLRVGPAASGTPAYALAFGAEDPPGACRPDRLEPPDPATAVALPDGFTTHLTLCAGDADAYAFRLQAWQAITAWVLDGTAAPHAVLRGPGGDVQAEGAATDFGEELATVAREEGTVVLVLSAPSEGWYDVAVQRE